MVPEAPTDDGGGILTRSISAASSNEDPNDRVPMPRIPRGHPSLQVHHDAGPEPPLQPRYPGDKRNA